MSGQPETVISLSAPIEEESALGSNSAGGSLGFVLMRRWRVLLLVTGVFGIGLCAAIWFLVKPKFQVTATVHVAPVVRPILFSDAETDISRQYTVYMATQAQALLSPSIVQATLTQPAVYSLPSISRSPNPAAMLENRIVVEQIRGTELLSIAMTGENPEDMVVIVNTLVNTYLRRREEEQRELDERILRSLRQEQTELSAKLDAKSKEMRDLAAVSGAAEQEGSAIVNWLTEVERMRTQANRDLAFATERLKALEESSDTAGVQWVDPEGFDTYRNGDPQWQGLTEQVRTLRMASLNDESLGRGPEHPEVRNRPARLASLETELATREEELRNRYASQVRLRLEKAQREAQATVKTLDEAIVQASAKHSEVARQQVAFSAVQGERDRLEQALAQVRQKIWNVSVEQNRIPRITIDSAAVAPVEPNVDKRMKLMAAACAMSLFLGVGAALVRHRFDHNIYEAGEIQERLGVPVLGSVQFLPCGEGASAGRDLRFLEPIRVISTALLAPTNRQPSHSRLITSATRGVGKSTVAMQLARSLSVTGRRVLLIDADNFGQGVTREFGLVGKPGLKDLLDGTKSLKDVVRNGQGEGLYVLPAGERTGQFSELLARDSAHDRLKETFRAYDEIIVDSPPVLAGSAAVILATLSDDVVLVVRAGQSGQHELQIARQHLKLVGGRVVGAVLNGVSPSRSSYSYYGYSVPQESGV